MAAIVAVATGASTAASATVYYATYRGTVRSGVDSAGRFGVAGADLTGLIFRAFYRIDDASPGAMFGSGTDVYGLEDPSVVRATFTLEGLPTLDLGRYYGAVSQQPHYLLHQAVNYAEPLDDPAGTNDELLVGAVTGPSVILDEDFRVQPGLDASADVHFFGSLELVTYRPGPDFADLIELNVTSVRAGAPEPASWALAILGFGATGGMLRRSRRGLAKLEG